MHLVRINFSGFSKNRRLVAYGPSTACVATSNGRWQGKPGRLYRSPRCTSLRLTAVVDFPISRHCPRLVLDHLWDYTPPQSSQVPRTPMSNRAAGVYVRHRGLTGKRSRRIRLGEQTVRAYTCQGVKTQVLVFALAGKWWFLSCGSRVNTEPPALTCCAVLRQAPRRE